MPGCGSGRGHSGFSVRIFEERPRLEHERLNDVAVTSGELVHDRLLTLSMVISGVPSAHRERIRTSSKHLISLG